MKEGKIKIRAYEELTDADRKLNQLKSRLKNLQEPITDQTRYVSDVVEAAHNALLSDYGIGNESFEWSHRQEFRPSVRQTLQWGLFHLFKKDISKTEVRTITYR